MKKRFLLTALFTMFLLTGCGAKNTTKQTTKKKTNLTTSSLTTKNKTSLTTSASTKKELDVIVNYFYFKENLWEITSSENSLTIEINNRIKRVITYDETTKTITELEYDGSDTWEWLPSEKTNIVWLDMSKILVSEEIHFFRPNVEEYVDFDDFTNGEKTVYEYDNKDRRTLRAIYKWSAESNSWIVKEKDVYSYNEDGYSTTTHYAWSTETNDWVLDD